MWYMRARPVRAHSAQPPPARRNTGEPAPPAVTIAGARKVFGAHVAVDDVSLTIEEGVFFGLVGPNGAGKSTLISMAVGLLRPDGGRFEIAGRDVWREAWRAKQVVGVLPDGLALPERLTGRELLTYLGRLRGLDAATVAARTDDLMALMGLDDAERTLVVNYSTGMRKKIGLAAALLHRPRVLVLDEPFEAVDPVSAAVLKRILTEFVGSGGTVLLSSHDMALVEQLCDTVAVLDAGRLVASGPVEDVRAGRSLEDRFVALVAPASGGTRLSWFVRSSR